ncbi:MAG: LacI family DNA-binding transcriptional regulator [Defluviitaleaceae bacterium]|nr:LacI family DNA-binding transcriptional regulator [Defluviitaleaceae bacterium]
MSRVTTIDIANKLGVSRGTVSKALNGRGKIDERTRLMVQKTADEMGYKRIWNDDISLPASGKTLSIMIQEQLFGDPYWAVFAKNFGDEAAHSNLKCTVDAINAEEEASLLLPKSFGVAPPEGIVTIGPISKTYYELLQASKIPAVYVDTASGVSDADIFGDTLFICNREYSYKMTASLIAQGHRKLGFVSSDFNCRSFYERWLGFLDAMEEGGLKIDRKFVYGNPNPGEMIEDIRPWIAQQKELPTAFVCANDFFAMAVKASLNEVGVDVPRDIALCGFDNDKRLAALYPDLTTADSSAEYMGKRAMQQLSWRLANPTAPYEVIKITSNVYYRNSTEGYIF